MNVDADGDNGGTNGDSDQCPFSGQITIQIQPTHIHKFKYLADLRATSIFETSKSVKLSTLIYVLLLSPLYDKKREKKIYNGHLVHTSFRLWCN